MVVTACRCGGLLCTCRPRSLQRAMSAPSTREGNRGSVKPRRGRTKAAKARTSRVTYCSGTQCLQLLRYDVEIGLNQIARVPAHHDLECPRLDDALKGAVQKRQFVGAEREFDGLGLPGSERNSLEAPQFLDRARN